MAEDIGDSFLMEKKDGDLHKAIDRGIRKGVARALQRHKERGESIYVWRDGKVVEIPPDQIPVPSGDQEQFSDEER
jgi:hypothetical protein